MVLIFLAALVAGANLFGCLLPFPNIPAVGERFRHFAENRNDYDTIFIGSSRFRHQVIPDVFDASTNESGMATNAFNLGYSGMWPPESFYYLRQILALKPARLKWVVIELMDYRYGPADDDLPTDRMVYWHDGRHTAMAWRLISELPLPSATKARHCARHALLFLQQFLHVGQGAELLDLRSAPAHKKKPR